ncbi:DNA polymerase III subunit beta [Pseudomonas azotoformans]|uniref:DNA polymerase III subunit beta n=1 Tax=Pseudomonas azotoformans TaxID=47878 RepID=A0A1V2JGN3_PSEAZ|nr:nucleotidyltransferase domain-containing protein [Pseudomonas azotoformans]OIN46082.1 DNA polymerase III subunit beta [Pseudomonas azotoformans]ONH44538.1 DNA polymerase III subunit beta [Pseudomonas azotoformans]SDN24256.1 Nucleotidyltransferase domain-containing protein [Pseudomonas azotoformans]
MSASRFTGVDTEGFILTVSPSPVQPEFQPLLEEVCKLLSPPKLGVDGIYLYGSVARGDALPGVSDLDLTLVLSESPTPAILEALERIRCDLALRHPQVTKVDFDVGSCAQVLAAENSNRWGFWLKHHCRCVWGNDLSAQFERFRPSLDIAQAVNGDFEAVLTAYLTRLAGADNEQERLRLQREASRKLIRSTQILCGEQASWPQTLEEHVALFVQGYPTRVTQVAFFLFEARNPSADRERFAARLQDFLSWMVSQRSHTAVPL